MRRPFSGISVTVAESMVCLKVASSVWRASESECTSTCSLVEPTVIFTFTEILLPTSRTLPVWVYVWKDGTDTVMVYVPILMLGKAYTPALSVFVVCATLVDSSVNVTDALAIEAPVASTTVPWMLPVPATCAGCACCEYEYRQREQLDRCCHPPEIQCLTHLCLQKNQFAIEPCSCVYDQFMRRPTMM